MKTELKSCPFCKGEKLSIHQWPISFDVRCDTCKAAGPSRETIEEAIEAWNRRAGERELVEALRVAYECNQNMHCYVIKGRLNEQLNRQTHVLREALAKHEKKGRE